MTASQALLILGGMLLGYSCWELFTSWRQGRGRVPMEHGGPDRDHIRILKGDDQ